ncbi:MAG: hypothetical protein D6773_00790, partial [Alphaproteobacteria bacterium]
DAIRVIAMAPLPDAALLCADISAFLTGPKADLVAERLETERSGATLLFDTRFSYFILLYRLVFVLANEAELDDFCAFTAQWPDSDDVYNQLRNILVQETPDAAVGQWTRGVRDAALAAAGRVIDQCMVNAPQARDQILFPNSGNISFFVTGLDEGADGIARLCKLNLHAERYAKGIAPFKTADGTTYLFAGRFHTIAFANVGDTVYFRLIQFHMQYLWFFLLRIYALIEHINQAFVDCAGGEDEERLNDSIAPLIMKIEMLLIYNEGFKVTIGSEFENIYERIQKRWNVEGALAGTRRFVEFLKGHLGELVEARRTRLSRRLDRVLVFISFIQVLGLIGVWGEYLSLGGQRPVEEFLGGPQALTTFNLFLPISLTAGVLAITAVLLMIRGRRG